MSATEYLYLKFSAYAGMFAVQAALHSLIAMVLAESAISAWEIRDPAVRQRFRFLVILVPIACFPLYQLIDPHRGDVYFRLLSLTDSNRWFYLEPISGIPALVAVLAIFTLTAVVFFLQELMPIAMHLVEKGRGGDEPDPGVVDEASVRGVQAALDGLPIGMDAVEIEDPELIIFSSTGFDPKVHISTGLAGAFTADQLKVAIAHEIAHIQRSRKPFLIIAYVLRMVTFYNPITLVVFRKLAQEEEMVCDDIAVQITGDRESLADAVDLLRPEGDEQPADGEDARGLGRMVSAVERYGLDVMLAHRAERISAPHDGEFGWRLPYLVTLASIVGVNYFVV